MLFRLLLTIAAAFALIAPVGSGALAESRHAVQLAQGNDATKGRLQGMRDHARGNRSNRGSARVNKPRQAQPAGGPARVDKPRQARPAVGSSPSHRRPPQARPNHRRPPQVRPDRRRPPQARPNPLRPQTEPTVRENMRRHIESQRRHSTRPRARPHNPNRAQRPGNRHAHPRPHWRSWHGHTVPRLPSHRHRYFYHGTPYFFFDNLWYRSHSSGFIVVAPPFGLVVPFVPSTYARVVIGNQTYLHFNGIYYRPVPNGYLVVRPPASLQELDALPDMPLITIVPLQGQSDDQLTQDKVDCHLRAVDQSGFDPRIEGGGVSYANYLERKHAYRQVISACLTSRDYEVS